MSSRTIVGAVAALAAAGLAGCAHDGEERAESPTTSERIDATTRGLGDAAVAPLRDINLIRPEIPTLLAGIEYPYETASLASGCMAIAYEIGQLDAVLGTENYQPALERRMSDRAADEAQDAAVGAARDVTSVIPFRGLVRRASGAARAERRVDRAYELGYLRRAFLRGYGASLGCPGVVPQPPPPPEEDDD